MSDRRKSRRSSPPDIALWGMLIVVLGSAILVGAGVALIESAIAP